MVTRLSFPFATAADVSSGFDSAWTTSSQAVRRKWVITKGASALSGGVVIDIGTT